MEKLSVQAYHKLRNKLWNDLTSCGVIQEEFHGENDAFKEFDKVLGEALPVDWSWDEVPKPTVMQELKELQDALHDSARTDWESRGNPTTQFENLSLKLKNILSDLENKK